MKETPKLYAAVAQELKASGDSRFCGAVALAVLTGCTAKQAQSELRKRGRKKGGGTSTLALVDALKARGYKLTALPRLTARCRTVRTLERSVSWNADLLVFTSSHVLAVKNGVVQDWTKDRLHRIKFIMRVEK